SHFGRRQQRVGFIRQNFPAIDVIAASADTTSKPLPNSPRFMNSRPSAKHSLGKATVIVAK
ncbi:MAG: hypothetical protein P8Y67_13275, partial [Alphaproteobacteria bacterium]